MKYKMSRIPFGTSASKNIFDIDTDLVITGMYHVEGTGFILIFRDSHCLGMVDYNGKTQIPWIGLVNTRGSEDGTIATLNFPSSICYLDKSRAYYLVENGGMSLRKIESQSEYTSTVYGQSDFDKYFSKHSNIELMQTACASDDKYLYWTVSGIHRCFRLNLAYSMFQNYIGTGKSSYIVSNDLSLCTLNSPTSIACVGKDIYLADTGNHCIRKVSDDGVRIVAGSPVNKGCMDINEESSLIAPSQIVVSGKIIYFVDNNKIKYLSMGDNSVGLVCKCNNDVFLGVNKKKDVFIMERI